MKQVWVILFLCLCSIALPQQVRPYPGARIDEAATTEAQSAAANQPGVEVTVYITRDSFDKVYAYYKKNAKEYKVIGARARKLPTGQELRDAFFILDEASALFSSKRWVKIQRPYLGQYGLARGATNPNEIRDVTAIVLTKQK
jgi:hypothetical protein